MPEGHHQVELDFEAEDHASGVIETLAEGAEHLSHKLEHAAEGLVELMGLGATLAGAFSFTRLVEGTTEYIKEIRDLSNVTGLATEKADGLMEVFERVGMSGGEATLVLQRMSMQALRLEEASMGAGGAANQIYMNFRRLHVDIRQGLLPSLIALSKQAEEGHISTADIGRSLMIRGTQAARVLEMLKQGPEKIKETMAEVAKSGAAVTQQEKQAYAEFIAGRAEVANAFRRIAIVVGREVMPVVTDLMKYVADHVRGWIDSAKEFGKFLKGHLHDAIGLAGTLGKILMVNFALQKIGAGGIGGAAASSIGFVRQTAASAAGLVGSVGGGALDGAAGVVGGTAAIGGLALAATLATTALENMAGNVNGVRDMVVDAFDHLVAAFETMFGAIDLEGKDLSDTLGNVLPMALSSLINAIAGVVSIIEGMRRYVAQYTTKMFDAAPAKHLWDFVKEAGDEMEAHARRRQSIRDAAGASAAAGKADINQNFFGARFDITQKFEEGFDADRVLTAFTHELGAVSERALHSGYNPAHTSTGSSG